MQKLLGSLNWLRPVPGLSTELLHPLFDTYTGEKTHDVTCHWLTCFATLGLPDTIKMENGPAYASEWTRQFLQQWGVSHSTGIPHSPTGQAIVECAHRTLKTMLEKQKKGELECPRDRLAKALHVLSFLNRDEAGQTACERQYSFYTRALPRPPVIVKDLFTGQWAGPVDLLMWGRGFACVSTGHHVKWVPLWCVRPFVASS